jgi:hypothetical protein
MNPIGKKKKDLVARLLPRTKYPIKSLILPRCCQEKLGNRLGIPGNYGKRATNYPVDRTNYPKSCHLTGQLVQFLPIGKVKEAELAKHRQKTKAAVF